MNTDVQNIGEYKLALSEVNRRILRNAKLPINEIADKVGLDPREVSERLTNLLESRGHLTDLQEERLLLFEITEMMDDARAWMDNAESTGDYANMMGKMIQGWKLMADRFDARRRLNEEDFTKITNAQALLWGQAIALAQERAVFELQKLYPDVDSVIVTQVFNEALPLAVRELETHVG